MIPLGDRNGRLVVTGRWYAKRSIQIEYEFKCDCGARYVRKIPSDHTRIPLHISSCGCIRSEVMAETATFAVGLRIGMLTIVEEVQATDRRERRFVVECDCGKRITKPPAMLAKNRKTACGCMRDVDTIARRVERLSLCAKLTSNPKSS